MNHIKTFLLLSTLFGSGRLADPIKGIGEPVSAELNLKLTESLPPLVFSFLENELSLVYSEDANSNAVCIWLLISLDQVIYKINQVLKAGDPYTEDDFMDDSEVFVVDQCSFYHSGHLKNVKMQEKFTLNRLVMAKNEVHACVDDTALVFLMDDGTKFEIKTYPVVWVGKTEKNVKLGFLLDTESSKRLEDQKTKIDCIKGSFGGDAALTYILIAGGIPKNEIRSGNSEAVKAKKEEQIRLSNSCYKFLTFPLTWDPQDQPETSDTVNTDNDEPGQALVC